MFLGLGNAKSDDPRVIYLENAFLAKEENLSRLGIKVGILGLPRTDFDVLLIPNAGEEDQAITEDAVKEKEDVSQWYEMINEKFMNALRDLHETFLPSLKF